MMKHSSIVAIFKTLQKANPEPKTELYYTNPFTLLVAIVLSAQATDVGVNRATPALFAKADSPQAMLKLGLKGLKQHIKTIGLFNSKATHIIGLCEKLIATFCGKIPETREALMSLPGVGRKTANVWLNCALGTPTIAVDTHVFRVANRLGITEAATVFTSEEQLEKAIPKTYKRHAHHWLILHGRYICKARKPMCHLCPVAQWCNYGDRLY